MVDSQKTSGDESEATNDWTFFAFIAVTLILLAAAFTWASVKSGFFANGNMDGGFVSDITVTGTEP